MPGLTTEHEESRGPSALYSQNRWNIYRCNMALTHRWPALWEPRPRLVGIGPSAHEMAVARCVGHIDEWFPNAEATPGTLLARLRGAVAAHISLESDDTIVLAMAGEPSSQGWCSMVSAVVHCAMLRLETIC